MALNERMSVIGAITTVDVADIKVPTGQISNSLAGRLAGVVAVQRSGEPGQSSNFGFVVSAHLVK